jgi:hypothetical protein
MIELRSDSRGAWAIPYRKKQRLEAVNLLDGTIVEEAPPDLMRQHLPNDGVPSLFELKADGSGEVTDEDILNGYRGESIFHGLAGIFLLPSGDVAAVYRAKVDAIDPDKGEDTKEE